MPWHEKRSTCAVTKINHKIYHYKSPQICQTGSAHQPDSPDVLVAIRHLVSHGLRIVVVVVVVNLLLFLHAQGLLEHPPQEPH